MEIINKVSLKQNVRVIGYGDNVVDRYINKRKMFPGGNALNFAVNAKKIGFQTAYLGEFGNDKEGAYIRNVLTNLDIDISKCTMPNDAVTEKADVEVIAGDRTFIGSTRGTRRAININEDIKEYISTFSILHSGCHAATENQLPFLGGLPIIKSFDFSDPPKYRTEAYLSKVCPFINVALFSCSNDQQAEIQRLVAQCHFHGVEYILLTRGIEPPIFFAKDQKYEGYVKPLEHVNDTMGAGDAFFTAFITTLLKSGWQLNQKDLQKHQIKKAFLQAANYSAEVCQQEGSFGYGVDY